MNHSQHPLRQKVLSVIIAFAQVISAVGAATIATIQPPGLESLTGEPDSAAAHNLQMEIGLIALDPSSRPLFDSRLANQQPLIQAGDTITIVFGGLNFIGTTDGLGGYFDFYPVTGTQVVNAEYVVPVPGGYAKAPIKKGPGPGVVIGTSDPTGQLKNLTLGPNYNGVTSKPASTGNVNLGTLDGFYGDTGIFYSTDPRTSQGSWGNTSGNIVNNRGLVVNDVPVTKYDIEQLRALGMSAPVNCIFDSACRGTPPWGMGSPIAGPESGYQWSFRITNTLQTGVPTYTVETGPFNRIQYPGSRISNDTPGNTSSAIFDTSKDASNIGFALSPATPLPATDSWGDNTSTKLVRFALGRIVNGQPEYARVAIKINNTSAILNAQGCPLITAQAFSGDAGILSGPKDHLWRYFDPTIATYNPCLVLFKEPSKTALAVNEVFTYSLRAFNTGPVTLTNVIIQDTLPAGLQYISAVPAPVSAGNPQTWNVGSLAPNKGWSAVLTVRALTPGIQVNNLALTSDQGGAKTQAIVGVAVPIMSETKSVAPTSVAPGGTVTYTIRLTNSGTGNSAVPIKIYETLPPGFTFTGLKSVTMNGANVTAQSSAVAGTPVTISLPATSFIIPNNEAVVVFTAQVGGNMLAGSYCNAFSTAYGTSLSQVANVACVTVGGAAIGDTVYRDWNGNGVQDPGEEGIPGAVVQLTPPSGPVITTTTNASGTYLFNGLVAGSYTVNVISGTAGYTATQGTGGYTQVLTSSQIFRDADFGFAPAGTGFIGNQVYEDIANNGAQDPGDPGISGVTVWLYEDTNGNGKIDAGQDTLIFTTTTGAGGFYTFTNLATGLNYIARVDNTDSDLGTYFSPSSYINSTPLTVAVTNLQPTGFLEADFGFWKSVPGSIGDTVCVDANLDGLCTGGEAGVPNVPIYLFLDGNLVATTTSSITGTYIFNNLGPGNYTVAINRDDPSIPRQYATVVTNIPVTLAAGQNVTTADFPLQPLLTKQVNRLTANLSDTLIYTITPNYNGSDLLDNLSIKDPLPAGTQFITASAGGMFGPFVPQPREDGFDEGDGSYTAGMTVTVVPSTTRVGGTVTVTMRLTSTTSITTVMPSLLPSGGDAACSDPSPTPPVTVTTSQLFTFVCTVLDYGEYTFLGSANGLLAGEGYDFPTGQSNSLLSSRAGSTSLVTWTLGSTRDAVDGVSLNTGSVPVIYATRGGNAEFDVYYVLTNTWSNVPANYGNNVKQGGALVWNGSTGAGASIFGLRGDGANTFKRYDVTADSWTGRANTPNNIKWGGALTRIGNVIYAFRGDDQPTFYTYTISSNTWATAASFGSTVKEGGSLTTDGTFVYGLRGDGSNQFRRYNPATNTWTALANTPVNIKNGGALVYLAPYIYALRGDTKNSFLRYNPATNTWAAMANTPANVKDGGALTTDGTYIYAFGGNATRDSRNFWRYDPATNKWTSRAAALGNIVAGGALAFVPGTATVSLRNSMDVNDTFVSSGQRVTLTMQLLADGNRNTVSPNALTISDTALAGGTATCAGPTPASTGLVSGTLTTFTWVCTLTATTRPANIFFSASANANGGGASLNWGTASSPSVIVVPPITMTLRVLSPTTVSTVDNVAVFGDDSGTVGPEPSNLVQTTIGSGIGDFVWVDLDRDGIQDPGEPGLAGVVLSLTLPNNTVVTTTTDLNGNYYFGNLGSGTFTVTYNLATAPAGYAPTTPIQLTYNITSAQVITTADFGLKPPGTGAIGDTVWLDADNDGVLDNGEQGLPGIGVLLYADVNNNGIIDAGDPVIQSTTTDATGYYTFTSLYGGPYLVQVNTSSTVTSSINGISNGITATLGAAMTPTLGTTITRAVTLATDSTFTDTMDFGFNWSASIGDYAWYDTSVDGIQNNLTDEGGAPNTVIELIYDLNGNGEYDPGEPILVYLGPNNTGTDSSGYYLFPNLPPGKYVVEGESQAIPAPPSTGALSGTVGVMINTTPYEIPLNLAPGQAYTQADFGFAAGAFVEGHVFYDENSNGQLDSLIETTGFAGVVVTLTGIISGSNTPVVLTTTTNFFGEYSFPPVLPGTYTVTYNTAAPALANFPLQTTPASQTFDLIYAQEKVVDFGRDYSGAIGDTVWQDNNGNATQNAGEPGIAGVTVLLYQNGTVINAASTSVSGTYLFNGLPAGTYTVTVLTSTIPPSYTINTTPVVTTVNLITNTQVLTADFGFRSPTPVLTVTGRVVSDTTGLIGVVDPTDPGLKPNVQVQLVYTPTGGSPITVTTPVDANGNYTVTGVLSGSNVLIFVVPATVPLGYTPSTTPTLRINNIITNTPNQNFGYAFAPALLAGTVVIGNGDGIAQVPTETVVSGVTITLLYAGQDGIFGSGGDDQTFTTTTNASGQYSFTNLLPGSYFVNEFVPAGYNALADRDGGTPTQIFASLAISQNLTGQDFELEIIPADLLVTKSDSADPIVSGNRLTYTIVVTNAGPGVSYNTVASDSLPAGVSYVSASPAPGSTNPITWALGTLGVNATRTLTVVVDVNLLFSGTLTNTAAVTSTTPDITPTNNTTTETTFVSPGVGNITGTVFIDLNGNGALDPGESGLNNITVLITDAKGLTRTVTTDANGIYTATNVPIGTATVDVVNPPAGYVQTAGTDPSTVNVQPADTANAGIDGYQPQADLRINKTNNLTQVVPGQQVTYTIVVTNSGPISVTGARITDTVPVTLQNAGWTCVAGAGAACSTPSSGSLNGVSVTLGVNSVLTFTLTGTVAQTATGNIANTAVVTPPTGITDPTPGNNTSTDDDPLVPQADLQVVKSNGVDSVTPGTQTTYRITVTNNGPSAVTGAMVTDTLPALLTNPSWTCASCTPASGSSDISVTVDLLSGQFAVIMLTGTVPATATGNISNTAVVAPPPGVTDTEPNNNTSTDNDPLVPSVDLAVKKTVEPAGATAPGTSITYTVVVSNAGPSVAVGAKMTDTLPALLTSASWACTATSGNVCNPSSGSGSLNGVSLTLRVNGIVTFVVTGTVSPLATGNIVNTAVVTTPPGSVDPTPLNNTSTVINPLTPEAFLGIFKTDNSLTAVPGARITYTIVVTNGGPSNASGVVISDAIPAELISPTWSCAGANGATCNAPTSGSGNISTTVNVPVNGQITFTVLATVSLQAAGKLTNTASLTPPPGVTNTNPVTKSTDVDDLTPAIVTGTIFVDTNGNGQLNQGEPGLPGMSVIITDSNGVTRTVPVDSNGNYTVTLPPGPFTTTVLPETVPPGYQLTTGNSTQTGTATPGLTPTDPVGYQPRGDLTGTVFLDVNNNGIVDPGEGLPNVQVVITDSQGFTRSVTTDPNGVYTATNVPSGTATVDVVNSTLPAGVTQTVGTDPSPATVVPNTTQPAGIDGYRQVGTLVGDVFLDVNNNGTRDPGEGLPNVQVVITDSAGLTQTVTTNANGVYTATNVTSGTATVDVVNSTLPPGVTQTVGTDPSTATAVPNTIQPAGSDGYRQLGTVYGFAYVDVDGNGSYNPLTDVVASGVTVLITDSAGLTQTMLTNGNGYFTFTNVTSGTAVVDLINPPAGAQTQGNDPTNVNVIPNQMNFEQNNGFYNPGTVTGTVFLDVNNNGIVDPGEGLPNVHVVITDSQGVTRSVITGPGGVYTATNVPSGTATVDVVNSTLPPGVTQTVGTDPSPVTVNPGVVNNAGLDGYRQIGRLVGDVFLDTNGNNAKDSGEGLPGVSVVVTDSAGFTQTVTTDANGVYTATNVTSGTATVDVVNSTLPPSVTQTVGTDPSTATAVPNTTQPAGIDGYRQVGTVTGTVFQDTDGNGSQGPGEPGIPNVTVLITDSAGLTRSVTTDANGVYTATSVTSGTATVDVVNSTLPPGLIQTAGTDPSTVVVTPNVINNAGIDGYQPTATVGDRVWEDYNFNGVQDAGEPGIAGVTVTLQTPTGTLTTVTSAGGLYTFTNIVPNVVCTLTFIAPTGGYTFTARDLGGNDATDSDPNPATGVVTFTLAPAEVNKDVDAGLWRPMTLGNSVWFDANGNGVQDIGEAGVPNVAVELYRDVNGNSVLDAGDSLVTSATTNAGGLYTFTNQISGTYVVVITSTNFAGSGALFNYQSSDGAVTGNSDQNGLDHGIVAGTLGTSGYVTSAVTLIPGTEPVNDGDANNNTNLTLDFGFYKLALAGNLVWQDFNNNGLYEPGLGETPIPSVTVILLNGQGTQLLVTQTDAGGLYTFTNLVSGTYQVQVVLPANYVNSTYVPPQTLGIDNDDNGVTTTLGSTFSGIFTLVPGASQPVNDPLTASSANNTLDFGLWQPMTLGGQVWNDKNNASGLENGEPTFAGVTVELYLADSNGLPTGAPVSTTTTSAGGYYTFSNVLSGTYVVVITSTNFAPGGVLAGYYNSDGAPVTNNNVDNDDDGRPLGAATASGPITLVPGTEPGGNVNTSVDFGFYTLSLGGKAWDDLNNDGRVNAGELALPGLTVNLYRDSNNDGTPDGGVISTTATSASGLYTFTGLISDTYLVEIIPAGNYTSSTGAVGSPTGPFEPAPDVDNDATLDDDNGARAGSAIRTAPVSLSASAEPTADDGDANTNFTIGFGLFQPISIGNQVWNDANNDGLLNNESGIDGVTVRVYSGTTLISTTTTSGGGFYNFAYLVPGNYVIEIVPLAGYVSSSGSNGYATGPYEPAPSPNNGFDNDDNGTEVSGTVRSSTVNVILGGGINGSNSYPTVDFGLMQPAVIGNFVWNDSNSNGIQDSGEPGLVGVQVVLYDINNTPIATTTTGAGGLYTFTKVIPGDYYLVFPQPVGYGRSPADANVNSQDALDSDADANGRTANFSVVAGQVKSDMDAGYFQYSSIGDRVWSDLNADGIQQAGEPGVTGVTVTLFYNGVPVSSTVTDNTGFYAFVNITPAVPLSVQVSLPAGYLVAPQNVGSDESVDNDANAQGGTDSVSIAQNSFYRDLDVALWAPLTLGGQVWNDLNNNGAQAASEPLKDGVLVKLYRDANDNGVFDAGDTLIQQTTTSNGGYYTFTNVIQGNYVVVLDASNFAPGGGLPGYKSSDFNDDTNANGDGLDDGRPALGGSIASGVIRLEAGQEPSGLLRQENYTVDFGVWLPASLGGVVWLDVNHNGQQDAGEPARNGVVVELRDAATDNVISTTTTAVINGVAGSYAFTNLIPGSYFATFPLPSDCVPATNAAQANNTSCIWTYPNVGNDATDSDVDANGQTGIYTLAPGQIENTVGAGYWWPAVLVPSKSTKVTGPVRTGDLITYTLEVRNAGDTLATSVVITDPLPNGVSFVSASDNGQLMPDGVVWRLADIPPGQIATVLVVVKVGNPVANALIVNVFTVANDGLPGTTLIQPSNQVSTPYAPTAVTLASFNAAVENPGVRVRWQTALERNSFGFYVLRSATGNRADAVQVNAELVLATGPSTYSVLDEGGSAGYSYWLQEIELDGGRIDYGPVVAQAVLPGVTQPNTGGVSAPAPQPAPGTGVIAMPGDAMGGGVPVAQAQSAQAPQPDTTPAQSEAQQPAVIPAMPAVILPEPTAQPPAAQKPEAQPASVEQPVQLAEAQPQPTAVPSMPVMPAATAVPVEPVVVGAKSGVDVARGGQPPAVQLSAPTTPADETVESTPQPINPIVLAGEGMLALLGLGMAGAFILRRRKSK